MSVEGKARIVHTRFAHPQHRGEIDLRARNTPEIPHADSLEHFLKEHYWGIYRVTAGASRFYRVEHPVWRTFPVEAAAVSIDPGALLGGAWRAVDWAAARHSVVLAEGSQASIYASEPLEG